MKQVKRGALSVLLGSVSGYGITYLLLPVISQLVPPDRFGQFSTVLAAASVLVGASTLRLEVLSLRMPNTAFRDQTLLRATRSTLAVSLATFIATLVAISIDQADPYWLCAAPIVFFGSLQLIATARMSSDGKYRSIAIGNFSQGGGTGAFQALIATVTPTVGGLVAGFCIARMPWLPQILKTRSAGRPSRHVREEARAFVPSAASSALTNSIGGQLPQLLVAALYGATAAGVFAMAVRLFLGPLGIVSQAFSSTALGLIGRHAASRNPELLSTVSSLYKTLLLIALIPTTLAIVAAPTATNLLFGPEWESTGAVIQALAIGGLFQFVGAPLMQVMNLVGASRLLLAWDATRATLFAIAFIGSARLDFSLVQLSFTYSAIMAALYAASISLVIRSVRRHLDNPLA